ncbi:MAG: L-ribulose-5-phosphate 4-epimerase [Fretibacterium sp.]|nr:L-ribulose-5-phosphate 4-epimerase [Fretibacterium sp.]
MYEELKREVFEANMRLVKYGMVILTWGNASGVDRTLGVVAIKPSGVSYEELTPSMIPVLDLEGKVLEGELAPSSDTATHLELYRAFQDVGGVAHTHSPYAVAWAQSRKAIPPLGTTHADTFYGPVPCTRPLTREEIETDYERNTGRVIVQAFDGKEPSAVPAALVAGHGPFTWGKTPAAAVEHAYILEEVARIASLTLTLEPSTPSVEQPLLDKHYNRKHGPAATYGQKQKL